MLSINTESYIAWIGTPSAGRGRHQWHRRMDASNVEQHQRTTPVVSQRNRGTAAVARGTTPSTRSRWLEKVRPSSFHHHHPHVCARGVAALIYYSNPVLGTSGAAAHCRPRYTRERSGRVRTREARRHGRELCVPKLLL